MSETGSQYNPEDDSTTHETGAEGGGNTQQNIDQNGERPEVDLEELRAEGERESAEGARVARERVVSAADSGLIKGQDSEGQSGENGRSSREQFIAKYMPNHLRRFNPKSLFNRVMKSAVRRFIIKESPRGVENIPAGVPKIFIVTHQKGEGEAFATLATSPEHVHFATANDVNWRGGGIKQWFQRQLGMLPVRESMSRLSDEEKARVVAGAPEGEQEAHQGIADRSAISNTNFFRSAVALLMRGENVGIFPEGLLTRLSAEEHQREAYPGFALIAKMYRQQTGEDVQIVPVAVSKGRVVYGEPFTIPSDVDRSRWAGIGTNALRNTSGEIDPSLAEGFKPYNQDGSAVSATAEETEPTST
ncbi:MAG: 1-acyl-sn-glycerol-3-phosphate acyltransferase [bacterium]|nr:1-acyl-sn-glycerol-3-phosphate acyltransferase [bacterium]